MTLNELFDINITDEQINNLETQCKSVLDEITHLLDKYGAPQAAKTEFLHEAAQFEDYVKQRCQADMECSRGAEIGGIVAYAYCVELKSAFAHSGLSHVHQRQCNINPCCPDDKCIIFKVDENCNLNIGIFGYDQAGNNVKDMFVYNEPSLFETVYEELVIDQLAAHAKEIGCERSKPQIAKDIESGAFGNEIYTFIRENTFSESPSFNKIDEVLKGAVKTAAKEHE